MNDIAINTSYEILRPCAEQGRRSGRGSMVIAAAALLAIGQPQAGQAADAAKPAIESTTNSRASEGAKAALKPAMTAKYGRLPLSFAANQGQADPQVKFVSMGQGYELYLTSNGAVLQLSKPGSGGVEKLDALRTEEGRKFQAYAKGSPADKAHRSLVASAKNGGDVLRMELKGADPQPKVSGIDPLMGKMNYFLGNDPEKWRSGVQTFGKVSYAGVYPGVDLLYYGSQRQLEYDFVVAPGADARPIRLHFRGARKLALDGHGDLRVIAENGEVAFQRPVIYQVENGRRRPVDGKFKLLADKSVGFSLGGYNHTEPLVIDPVLAYSTYLGGSGTDKGQSITVDAAGSAYVTGSTSSTNFPTIAGGLQTTFDSSGPVAFVTKFSADGQSLVYSTFLGGNVGDQGNSIAVDTAGDAYITGYTFSTNFPVSSGAFQASTNATEGQCNAFVTELNPTGSALIYSTYLGGKGNTNITNGGDFGEGIAVDSGGNAYVAGYSYSVDFPVTRGAYQSTNNASRVNGEAVFLTKLNPTGSALVYSTYLGGTGSSAGESYTNGTGDGGTAVAIDASGNAYVAGFTNSSDFPITEGAYQTINNTTKGAVLCYNGFVAKFDPAGTAPVYSTYLGGSSGTSSGVLSCDGILGIALDSSGNVYVTGTSGSSDFPTTAGAFQRTNNEFGEGYFTGFVTKLNDIGNALTYSTYLGGSGGSESGNGVAVDTDGDAFVTGNTKSASFPVSSDALQLGNGDAAQGKSSAFVTEVNVAGSALPYSTYLGGSGGENGNGIALDGAKGVYVTGVTGSTTDFPLSDPAYQASNTSTGGVAFVTKFDAGPLATALTLDATPLTSVSGQTVTITATLSPFSGSSGTTDGETITFVDGSTVIGTGTLSGGVATFATNTLPVGENNLSARFDGDANFAASTASLFIVDVSPPTTTPTTLALTAAPASSFVGQPVTLTATLTPFSGSGVSTDGEPVTFSIGGTPLGSGTLAGGVATFTTSALPLGSSSLTATYAGDTNFATSTSPALSYTVTSPVTTTTLTLSSSSVASGTPVTLTASVVLGGAPVTPGMITFCDSTAAICQNSALAGTAQLTAAGTATLKFVPGIGSHSYVAIFAGTATATGSTSASQTLAVTGLYPTTTTITASGGPGNYTLTGTVVGAANSALTPGGSVAFLDTSNGNASLGVAALGAGAGGQTLVGASGSPLTAGTSPYSVAAGDFNQDGFLDFAVGNYGDGTIGVFLGNGDGTFKPRVTYPVGKQPERVVAADVNGDGKVDLLVANTGSGTVGVLLGNGDGTFQTQVEYSTTFGSASLVVADFNGDGKPDIAVSNFYSATVSVLTGNGDGTFSEPSNYGVGNQPRTLTFGDFNGDGKFDLAVANEEDSTLSILIGNGDGSFHTQVTYPTGNAPEGVVVSDFNADGKPDLALANSGDGTVGIMLGKGDGTFQAMTTFAAGGNPLELVAADFNADGKTDIAVENFKDGTESVLLGNGDGTLQTQTTFSTGTNPYGVASGDFNGDGLPDLVISNFGSNNETILVDQITATATANLTGVAIPGVAGTHTVAAQYAGDANFSTSTSTTIPLVAVPSTVVLLNIAPVGVAAGSGDTKILATGSGYTSTSVVNFNGTALATTQISATQLSAIIPAAALTTAGSASVTVTDSSSESTTPAQTFTIAPALAVTFSGPPTADPGAQMTSEVSFVVSAPYPSPITGTISLSFTPDPGNPAENDELQFASPDPSIYTCSDTGTSCTFTLAANTTTIPPILLQVGTISGTITITLQLSSNGVNVTPPGLAPVTIVVSRAAPTITSLSLSKSGSTLTVLVTGFSSTREIQSATFTFTPAKGASLSTKTLTVPATTLFQTWYGAADSVSFGSAFTYTQAFTLSGDASAVGSVGATLTNSVGTSSEATAP